ncbi:MAG: Flp pilus assembly protein CpaB [Acidocella sp. 20-57-95]|nr:MAG: Flp pilus assembly protein CpaB [Acidocella sp. 20-57-95]OYV57897.1 MAG: Flp pilus assembly protein CpaB [Acidocella sp. 21-58-7]HQT65054.1 Flp pilus assembly protein CpaB [Acidocella sp.]HQU05433.1 Flp pilus assembly protein CpaB [Acidocella sp.]
MVAKLALFLVLVIALIAVSIFGVSMMNQSSSNQSKQVAGSLGSVAPTQQILVAAGLEEAGSLLQPSDIRSATVLANAVPPGASLDTPENRSALIGAMTRTAISPGAPILDGQVIHPGDHGFLAAVLAPGMVATTVGVDAISGAAGLIWPGDHVDLLLTETLDDPSVPLGQRIVAEVVMRDIRVIATGQQLVQGGQVANNGKSQAPATTVTLEVTPDQAARTAVATKLGPLSLVVHSAETTPGAKAAAIKAAADNAPVYAGQVSPALNNDHAAVPGVAASHVTVIGGSGSDQEFKF